MRQTMPVLAKPPQADPPAARPSAGRRPSAAVAIHGFLQDEIITLTRPPGAPVNERAIASHFGVSRTPVREALLQLASEGLIELVPQVGTFVARIPVDQLPEAVLVRQALEEATARLAAQRARPPHIAAMHAAIGRQRQAVERGDSEGFHVADEELHAHIAEASGFPRIWRLVRQAKVQLDRYRRATHPQAGRFAKVIDQHLGIVAAIEQGESALATERMREHISALSSDLAAIRSLHPEWFTELPEEAEP